MTNAGPSGLAKSEAFSAFIKGLNQLSCVIAGRETSLSTNDLVDDPLKRLLKMQAITALELQKAAADGDTKALNQAQRKVQSLASLVAMVDFARPGWKTREGWQSNNEWRAYDPFND